MLPVMPGQAGTRETNAGVSHFQVVDSGCNVQARSSMNAAMGGQRLLWQAADYSALPDAIADCAYSIAFGRWAEGEQGLGFGIYC